MNDRYWMQQALFEARKAFHCGEVPVGAIIVKDDRMVATAHNLCETNHDPSKHAELLAMQKAYQSLGSLRNCTLYVTLEPCAMCAGAMLHYQLPRLVFGAFDAACGCCGSRIDLTDHWFDHSVETVGGILEPECSALLSAFFAKIRNPQNGC